MTRVVVETEATNLDDVAAALDLAALTLRESKCLRADWPGRVDVITSPPDGIPGGPDGKSVTLRVERR